MSAIHRGHGSPDPQLGLFKATLLRFRLGILFS